MTDVPCDWCDSPAAVSNAMLGNLCRSCLAGEPSPGEAGGHYQLRHEPYLAVCFSALSAAAALERLAGYLEVNAPAGMVKTSYQAVIADSVHDGTGDLLIDQGVCVPLGGAENVQMTTCYCDDLLET